MLEFVQLHVEQLYMKIDQRHFSTYHMFSLFIIYILFQITEDINCFTRAMVFLEGLKIFQYFAQRAMLTVNACTI